MIKFLHHIILSLLFVCLLGLSDVWGQDQHVCADTLLTYKGYGGGTSVMKWYLDGVDDTPEKIDNLSGVAESTEYPGYHLSEYKLTYTSAQVGDRTISMIETNGICDSDPKSIQVRVYSKPLLGLPVPTHTVCAGDKGELSVSVTATVPPALQLQYKLVDVTAGISFAWINDNSLTRTFTNLTPGRYKVQIRYVLGSDNSINVKGSWSESNEVEIIQNDNVAPVISNMPTDILITNCKQVVNWVAPTATDNCGTPTLTSNHNPGKTFPEGETTVTYTADDGTNTVQKSFKVTVQDGAQAPLICFQSTNYALGKTTIQSSTYPGGTSSKAVDGNSNGVWNNSSVTHTNNDAQAWWQVDLGAEESVDYVNVYRRTDCCQDRLVDFYVMLSANDLQSVSLADALKDPSVKAYYVAGNPGDLKRLLTSGNTARYVKIQLKGTNYLSLAEVEVMGCTSNDRSDITIAAENGKCGAQVSWDAPAAVDNCGTVTLSSNHNSGDEFPVGTTTVTYTATDGTNPTTSSFDVIVTDDQAPVISGCPTNITVGACSNTVNWTAPTATDNCSVTLTSTHNSGDVFNVGTTTVVYTATDASGNKANCSFDVIVSPVLTIALAETTPVACYGETAEITITAGGGDGAYTYSKDGTNYQSGNTFNLPAGTHTLYVKDGNSCVVQDDITITQPTELTVTLTPSKTTICEGEEVTFTIDASGSKGSYVYMFYVNGNYVDGSGDYTLNAAKNVMTSTKFKNGDKISIQVESESCQYDTPVEEDVVMVVNSRPTPTITGDLSVCAEDTAVYTTETGMSNYNWTVTGGTIVDTAPYTNVITVKWGVGASGSVSVNYENADGCSATGAKSEIVTINELPNTSEILHN